MAALNVTLCNRRRLQRMLLIAAHVCGIGVLFSHVAYGDWLLENELPEINHDLARSLVGDWRFYNCDIEVHVANAADICGASNCPSSLHVFLRDRIRGNEGLITFAILDGDFPDEGSQVSGELGVGSGVFNTDIYDGRRRDLSVFARGASTIKGKTRRIETFSDFLRLFRARWNVQCGRELGD